MGGLTVANEKRLIDAIELANFFGFMRKMWSGSEIINVIHEADTVDAVEVVHGRWCFMGTWEECSICGHVIAVDDTHTNYCPNCGAKMDGGKNGENK